MKPMRIFTNALFVLLAALASGTHAQTITEFSAGISAGANPLYITAGPDGNLWFTENSGNRIGRITMAGVVTQFSSGITGGSSPLTITTGPTGTLWFSEGYVDQVGRITTAGVITEFYSGISPFAAIGSITLGPDGNLWFTETGLHQIGRITPAGVVTEFSAGITYGASPFGITAGPDGNLWFTERDISRIGRITPTGVVTEFSVGISPNSAPMSIAAGPDGKLWFTEYDGNRIGRITTTGTVTEFSTGITAGAGLTGIAAGPDGNIWFTEYNTNKIGRVSLAVVGAPTMVTGAASAITKTDALLNGTVSANGSQTAVVFQYGLTAGYGTNLNASQSPLGSGAVNTAVSVPATGLTCGTLYHFRVTATNTSGSGQGSDASFTTSACPPVVTGNNPMGAGTITASVTGCGANCGFARGAYIATTGAPGSPPVPPPAAYDVPYGLFDFSIAGLAAGASATVTISYPAALPSGAVYAKYGPTPTYATPHWYLLPATVTGSQMQITITDGGLGDNDLAANGTITDPGGPGYANGSVAINIDADGNGQYDALTDGLLVLRYLFGLNGPSLTNGVIGQGATRTDPVQMVTHLDAIRTALDIDANGQADALTDGLMLIRYLFGLRDASMINGAIGTGAMRATAPAVEAYILGLKP